MDGRDDAVDYRRKELAEQVRSGNGLRLCTAMAVERRPDGGEAEQQTAFIRRKPNDVLLGRQVRRRRIAAELFGGQAVFSHPQAVMTYCGYWWPEDTAFHRINTISSRARGKRTAAPPLHPSEAVEDYYSLGFVPTFPPTWL
jgi:hypothetical protein